MPEQGADNDSQQLLETHRRRLAKLLHRRAVDGSNVPPEIEIDIEDVRAGIRELKKNLRASGVVVIDHFNDDEHPKRPFPPAPRGRSSRQSQIVLGIGLLLSLSLIGALVRWLPDSSWQLPNQPSSGPVLPTATSIISAAAPSALPTTSAPVSTAETPTTTEEYICAGPAVPKDGFGGNIVANVDKNGNLYVADVVKQHILKLPSSGIEFAFWQPTGKIANIRGNPLAIATDNDGNVYIIYASNRIGKFDSNGNFQTSWGSAGAGDGQFNEPHGIAVDSSGYVYVADTNNNRIQKFDSNGDHQTSWGSAGAGDGQFNKPLGIAVDSSGYVYVADTQNYRIQKFDSNGELQAILRFCADENDRFSFPRAVSVDEKGWVYVVDSGGKRILIFRPK